jgi:predicted transcriptional regulator
MKTVQLEIKRFDDVISDVTAALAEDKALPSRISFDNVAALWKILSPKKMELLQSMAGQGYLSIREIARRVGRDVSAVHRDIQALADAGLVERNPERQARFPYDEIHVDFVLHGAA